MDHDNKEQEVIRKEESFAHPDESEEKTKNWSESHMHEKRERAGFWIRFWAYLIDLVVLFSLNGILLSPLMFVENDPIYLTNFFTLQGLLSALTSYLYFLLMTKAFGQTLGKMILGVKVVRTDGAPLTWSDLLFREVVGRFIHRSLVITNVLYLVVGVTRNKQGIHDMFGNTSVIHVEK